MFVLDYTAEDSRILGRRIATEDSGFWLLNLLDNHSGKAFGVKCTDPELQLLLLLVMTIDSREVHASVLLAEEHARSVWIPKLADCPQECYPFP